MISAFSSCLTALPSDWPSWGQNQDLTIILIGYSHHHNHRPRSNSIQLHYKIVYNSDRIEKLIVYNYMTKSGLQTEKKGSIGGRQNIVEQMQSRLRTSPTWAHVIHNLHQHFPKSGNYRWHKMRGWKRWHGTFQPCLCFRLLFVKCTIHSRQ